MTDKDSVNRRSGKKTVDMANGTGHGNEQPKPSLTGLLMDFLDSDTVQDVFSDTPAKTRSSTRARSRRLGKFRPYGSGTGQAKRA